ncbi:PAS domain S-box-containing protein [Bacillus mesophilus]|uniref:PAS domain-containing protein n=1 Tax=Bacillus mesophilus TaxID=1808955 RepID=A0A6M0Q8J5_9BACI|nr:PAS domain-containing protein [Bacillus mesophilus]MBM7661950.1 PAS domain S-box-containing protein [Bacillus mesophilus]NEY72691.1 PAS domain-containing protein [Bacillus mesophilus]
MEFNLSNFFEDMIDYSPDLIMLFNTKGEYIYVNETTEVVFGIPKEEYLGKHFSEVNKLTEDSLQYCLAIFPDLVKGNTKVIKLNALNYKEEEITLSVNCKMITKDGISYLYTIFRDITKEYVFEKDRGELLEFHQLLGKTLDQLGIGIVITDPNQEDHPIIYANKGFKKMTGYKEKEFLGRNCRFLQGSKSDQEVIKRIREKIDNQMIVHEEILNYRKDQSSFWNEITLSPVMSRKGKLEYYIGFQRDITERKKMEIELKKDLALARNLQQLLLSNPIKRKDIEIVGYYRPSQELGGDFYKWVNIKDGLYAVFIIDVMGHGITSSLITMLLHTEIQSMLKNKVYAPDELFFQLNKNIQGMFSDESDFDLTKYYFTCVYLFIDINKKRIDYVNAGHPDFILKKNNHINFYPSTTIPVGLLEEVSFETHTIHYESGTDILLYTDGLMDSPIKTKHDIAEAFVKEDPSQLVSGPNIPGDDICLVHLKLR